MAAQCGRFDCDLKLPCVEPRHHILGKHLGVVAVEAVPIAHQLISRGRVRRRLDDAVVTEGEAESKPEYRVRQRFAAPCLHIPGCQEEQLRIKLQILSPGLQHKPVFLLRDRMIRDRQEPWILAGGKTLRGVGRRAVQIHHAGGEGLRIIRSLHRFKPPFSHRGCEGAGSRAFRS